MKQYSIHCEWEHKMNEYKINEIFIHTDGKAYQCVEGETCEGCAFRCTGNDCVGPYCDGGSDGRPVKFIAVTEPVEGMLYRAKNGRMYRLAEGSHWDHWCACDDDPERSCAELDMAVFGGRGTRWHWAPTTDYAPASDESPKPIESLNRHIELSVVRVENDKVTFKIVEQTHRCDEFSQQGYSGVFKSANGFQLKSCADPEWNSKTSTLHCRGFERNNDNFEIVCSAIEFVRISEAVAEYNSTDGRGYEKPWPQAGDKYFCIVTLGRIERFTFYGNEFGRKMQAFGNFFRTKEEAEAALERVKQALKEKAKIE